MSALSPSQGLQEGGAVPAVCRVQAVLQVASLHLIKLLLLQTCPGFQNVQSLCLLSLASPPVEIPVLAWGQ